MTVRTRVVSVSLDLAVVHHPCSQGISTHTYSGFSCSFSRNERIRKRRSFEQGFPSSLKQGHRECTKPKIGRRFVPMRGTEMLT